MYGLINGYLCVFFVGGAFVSLSFAFALRAPPIDPLLWLFCCRVLFFLEGRNERALPTAVAARAAGSHPAGCRTT